MICFLYFQVCDLLIESGARITEQDNEGRIPVLLAAQEGHVGAVMTLIENGSPLEAKAHDGKTCLRVAALEGHRELVDYLLSQNADMDYRDADGRSTLYVLALENHIQMARVLLDAGADVETKDLEGRTALHVAAWQGHYEMVDLLLINGSNVNAIDNDRRTALQSASWQGHSNIVRLLLERSASVDHTCNQGATALCIAAQEGHTDVVKILLKFNANPNHADQYGRTATRVALKGGHHNVVKLLEEHGAHPLNGVNQRRSVVSTSSNSSLDTKHASTGTGPTPYAMFGAMPVTHRHTGHIHHSHHATNHPRHYTPMSPGDSPGSSYDRRKSYNSATTKSSKQTDSNTSSTNQSSQGSLSLDSPGLSFTQQLQQCSMSKNRNRPLSRVLSPVSEPHSASHSPPGSPMSEIQSVTTRISPDAQSPASTKQNSPKRSDHHHGKPVHIIANPHADLGNNANNSSSTDAEEPIWQRISEVNSTSRSAMDTRNSAMVMGKTALSLSKSNSPESRGKRNGIVTNPNYSKSVNINGYFNKLANLPDPMDNYPPVVSNGNGSLPQQNGSSSSNKPRRPNGLPIKKETPL